MDMMFKDFGVVIGSDTDYPVTFMCRDREATNVEERWVLSHITKEDVLKMCDAIIAEIKKNPDYPKIVIDTVSNNKIGP